MIYPDLLKSDFERLPASLRGFHAAPGGGKARGTVTVRHASKLLAWLAGFPPEGEDIPMLLEVTATEHQEVWTRRFGDTILKSLQRRRGDIILETFGPVRILLRVTADEGGMRIVSEGVWWWMIPLPLGVDAREWGDSTHWSFDVKVRGLGSYRGELGPA